MSCLVCDLDQETKEEINTLIKENDKVPDVVKLCRGKGIEITMKDITSHKRHMDDDEGTVFCLRDGTLYDAETNEAIDFLEPQLVLKIIITLGVRNALKSPNKIGMRYVVEAAKILSEVGTNNLVEELLQGAYLDKLKTKPSVEIKGPVEIPYQATSEYRVEQERKKEEFLQIVRPNSTEV